MSPDEAAAEVERDPVLAEAFRQAYTGPGDALEALRRQSSASARADGTRDRLREARAALYRPGVSEADRQHFSQLEEVAADECRAVQDALVIWQLRPSKRVPSAELGKVPAPAARQRRVISRGREITLVGFTAALLVVLPVLLSRFGGGSPVMPSPPPTFTAADLSSVNHELPARWRHAPVTALSQTLDGNTPLVSNKSIGTRVLLLVRCPTDDRSYQAVVRSTGDRGHALYGPCGRQSTQVIALDQHDTATSVLVTTRGILPFTAALLQQ